MKTALNYSGKSDEEIVAMIHQGNTDAVNYLMEKYKNLVRQKARKLFLIGGDKDDLIQEGMIGLYKAIYDFDESKESSFGTFADLCVSRKIYDAIKASNRQKNIPLNTYISFYSPAFGENPEGEERDSMLDLFFADNKKNPEEQVIDKENIKMLEQEINACLSEFEKKVLRRFIDGNKYGEIAGDLGCEPKAVDNALQRIKGKLSKIEN